MPRDDGGERVRGPRNGKVLGAMRRPAAPPSCNHPPPLVPVDLVVNFFPP